jgi:DNA-binding transcriptional LysR family regulator
LGIGFLPEWLFKTELQEGKVKRLLTTYKASSPALNATTPISRRYSAKVTAFLDYLSDYLAKEGSVSEINI